MNTEILNKLTDQEIFGLICMATDGEIGSDTQKNILVRGEVYSIKSMYPKTLIGRMLFPNVISKIEFTDTEVIKYKGKNMLPLVNLSYHRVIKALIQPVISKENTKEL